MTKYRISPSARTSPPSSPVLRKNSVDISKADLEDAPCRLLTPWMRQEGQATGLALNRWSRRDFFKMVGTGVASLSLGAGRARGNAAATPASIQFWDMQDGPVGTYGDAAKKLVSLYNVQNPHVPVTYELEQWQDWPQLFSIAVAEGLAPDLSTGGSYQAVQYFERGDVMALDDVVADLKRSGEDRDFLPGTLERMVYNGHTVGLPWGIDLRVIFYRKDLFAKAGIKPPQTWEEIREAAKALTSPGQYGLFVAQRSLIAMHTVILLMLNNGGGIFTADGKVDLMDDRNLEAVKFFSDLVKDGSVNPASLKMDLDDGHKEFFAGRGAMLFDPLGLQTEFPDQIDKIGLLSPPIAPHGDQGTISWVTNLMLYKQSKNPEAAKTFLKWWSANQRVMWTEGHCGPIPVRASINSDAYFRADPIMKKIIDEWMPVGKSAGSRKSGIFPALNSLEGYGPLAALAQDILKGNDPIDSLQLADQRLKTVIAQTGSL